MAAGAGFSLVTDTASDLPLEWCQAHDVTLVPLHLRLRKRDLRDVYDTDAQPVSQSHRVEAPAQAEFEEAFLQAGEAGSGRVVCVTVSGRLSSTYRNAVAAAERVASQVHVAVVDSRSGSAGEALLVQALWSARDVGMGFRDAGLYAQALAAHVTCVGLVPPTIPHFKGVGPVRTARTSLRRRLGLSTLVAFNEGGDLVSAGSFRNLHDPAGRVARLMRLDASRDGHLVPLVSYAGNPYALRVLARELEGQGHPFEDFHVLKASSAVTSFVGSGAAGVAYVPSKYLAGPLDAETLSHGL